MRPNDYSIIYAELIGFAKSLGLKVLHCRMKEDEGRYNSPRQIIIDSRLAYLKAGAMALSHEIIHFTDRKAGKYPAFYQHAKLKWSPKNFKMVVDAEQSASRGAQRLLARYGRWVEFDELICPKRYYTFWRRNYFHG